MNKQLTIVKSSILVPIAYMLFIFILSSIPATEDKLAGQIPMNPMVGNLFHIPLFGMLAFLWMGYFREKGFKFIKAALFTMVIVVLYAFTDEFHQMFVPGRYASFLDITLDTLGCLGVVLMWRKF
ncbi:MAG: VanZ family protein [Candidatus Omnitrophota bacterium]